MVSTGGHSWVRERNPEFVTTIHHRKQFGDCLDPNSHGSRCALARLENEMDLAGVPRYRGIGRGSHNGYRRRAALETGVCRVLPTCSGGVSVRCVANPPVLIRPKSVATMTRLQEAQVLKVLL